MRRITFDIETIGDIRVPEYADLKITVVGVHDSQTDDYETFLVEEFNRLWPVLELADILIGYNSDHFDIPILNRYYPGDLTKIHSLDILKEIRSVLGRRLKLDNIAEATLGKKKTGNGLEAISWWEKGLVDDVKKYCLDDVKITKEIYDYALANKSLKYRDLDGLREIKLNTSQWENLNNKAATLTHTLPF